VKRATAWPIPRCRPLRGLNRFSKLYPGAGAPGFMLAPASRAQRLLGNGDPGACAPGFMLTPASRAKNACARFAG